MKNSARTVLILLSVIAVLNVMLVPVFDVWGGLYPDDVEDTFFDVMEMIKGDSDCWDHWVVILTMIIFIPSLLMLIMSLIGSRPLFIIANAAGIFFWFKEIRDYCDQYGTEVLFDFEDGSVCIGTWIAIALFIISFLVVLGAKKRDNESEYVMEEVNSPAREAVVCVSPQPEESAYLSAKANMMSEFTETVRNYCPECGEPAEEGNVFCGKCGHKLQEY